MIRELLHLTAMNSMMTERYSTEEFSFKVPTSGQRLDLFLSEELIGQTRSSIQNLILKKYVTVNGQVSKASYKVKTGELVSVMIPLALDQTNPPIAQNLPLTIVYEDSTLLVVNKAAGISVHPGPGHSSHTLVNALLWHYPDLQNVGESLRPGIVHRLDKDTSGLMAIAKTSKALKSLQKQWKDRAVTKRYWALVQGCPSPTSGIIELPIGRDPRYRQKMAVVASGKPAITSYQTKEEFGAVTLLDVSLETGRTHQIRVHMAAIGHPLIGDQIYNKKSSAILQRQFLHAHTLGFHLPNSGNFRTFCSSLPHDLNLVYEGLLQERER